MKYTPLSFEVNLRPEGFVMEIGSLFSSLMQLHDKRDARGLRYTLVTVLVHVILAKLSGESFVRGIADWVKLRKEHLAEALGLAKVQAPHATTYTRILGHAIAPTTSRGSSETILLIYPRPVPVSPSTWMAKPCAGRFQREAHVGRINSRPICRMKVGSWCKWRSRARKTRSWLLRSC